MPSYRLRALQEVALQDRTVPEGELFELRALLLATTLCTKRLAEPATASTAVDVELALRLRQLVEPDGPPKTHCQMVALREIRLGNRSHRVGEVFWIKRETADWLSRGNLADYVGARPMPRD